MPEVVVVVVAAGVCVVLLASQPGVQRQRGGSEVRVVGPIWCFGIIVGRWCRVRTLHWTHPRGDNEPPGERLQASVDDDCERCDADDDGGVA